MESVIQFPDVNMRETYKRLAAEILQQAAILESDRQLFIGICGPPGGGKTSTAHALNALVPNSVVVPMDGYHYSKARLSTFPDPKEAHLRRGAHWTFDGERFVNDLRLLRKNGSGTFPAFSHGIGDPEESAIEVLGPSIHKVVIVEGNYLTLDIAPWSELVHVLDHIYFLDCPLEVAERRVALRHMAVNGNSEDRAWERVRYNDSPNAQLVLESKRRADTIVQSL